MPRIAERVVGYLTACAIVAGGATANVTMSMVVDSLSTVCCLDLLLRP
jgi:hypothetical protein